MIPTYSVKLNDSVGPESLKQMTRGLEHAGGFDVDETTTLEVSGSSWLDYADLGFKALLVIAAFVIAAKLERNRT